MSEMTENDVKKLSSKLKMQERELHAVKALINRSNGYAKTQAEASETRLTEEIAALKQELGSAPASPKASPKAKVKAAPKAKVKKVSKAMAKPATKAVGKKPLAKKKSK